MENTPPPQEQQAWRFAWFLGERFSGLVTAIGNDSRLTDEDRNQLSFFILVLSRDSVDQSINLSNRALLGSQEIKPETLEYMDALRGAYAMFLASTPEALEDIPEQFRDSIKQSLELKNCLALSWSIIHTQSQNQ